ncbi:MAG: mannonate dehydratase [Ruminococcaceae bacterium]|nr:mannonate dehydratase [Oscillospiraceae bacterium]
MLLTDILPGKRDLTWDYAKQCGVNHAVLRLPETDGFDVTNFSHWQTIYKNLNDLEIKPVVIEPMPNYLHNHIKTGDSKRDWAIEQVIKMLPIMDSLDIRTICFNWMAHIGWLRTSESIIERGGSLVTGFDINDFKPTDKSITANELWENYEYFIKAVIPYAEKYNINLALHPDDPPLEKLGDVSRIMISLNNIEKAISGIVESKNLGVTMCQATYYMMGENLYHAIEKLKDKIFFIHFRNAVGNKLSFRETFHDNGELDMANLIRFYNKLGINVPIRVDHVPLFAGETQGVAGYSALGRLYAIGYLKGILEAVEKEGK